jgi:hypothetical protein
VRCSLIVNPEAWRSVRLADGKSVTSLVTSDVGARARVGAWTDPATCGAGVALGVVISGLLRVDATAGSLAVEAAQNTADASDTIVHLDSHLIVQPIA